MAEDAKRIDRLITLLLALTAVYALALGMNSYFGLKQVLDTAKEDSKRTLDDIRDRYPELANWQMNLRTIMSELRSVFEAGEDWTEHAYGKLSWRKRQEILMAELRFAGLEVFRLEANEAYRPRVMEICQGLGRFYSSKYLTEGFRLDWNCASIYFERAMRQGTPSARLLKDLGVHFTQPEVRSMITPFASLPPAEQHELKLLRKEAETAFSESLALNKAEPGALFGQGWLLYRKGNYEDAIVQYSRLTKITEWREAERRKFLADGYRNIACCRHLRGEPAALVFEDVKKSIEVAKAEGFLDQWIPEILADDDLKTFFAAHPEDTAALTAAG